MCAAAARARNAGRTKRRDRVPAHVPRSQKHNKQLNQTRLCTNHAASGSNAAARLPKGIRPSTALGFAKVLGIIAPNGAALVEMSTKSFGCVGIVDRAGALLGIITDGDLRRHMRPDLLDARVEQVMTRTHKTLRTDQLASEALELFNASKITAAIVIENDKPVGVVHLHDLLRAGVA
jgi:hypothetical protein